MRPGSVPTGGRRAGVSAAGLTIIGWAVAGAGVLVVTGSPQPLPGFRDPSLHLVLDTVDTCVALLVACLAHGRLVRGGGTAQDLLLAQGLVLLALAGSGLTYLADLVTGQDGGAADVWLPLTIRVLGALVLVAASFAGARAARSRGWRPSAVVLPVAVVLAVFALFCTVRPQLPPAVVVTDPTSSAEQAVLSGHPVLLAAHLFSATCFAVASIAFAVRATRRDDPLLRWLGPALALATSSRVAYLVVPSLYTDWIYAGDVMRTGCYVLLLVGAVGELRQYWRARPREAVQGDRRRVARSCTTGWSRSWRTSAPRATPSRPGGPAT